MMRVMLYEAAQSMLHSKKWSWLKAWAMQIARRRGMKKAIVALARRLAVIMHRIWVDGTEVAASDHSITSSARRRNASGIVNPSTLATLRLMTSSNLVGCRTGSPVGFSPLRTCPT
jgi:hypothetical protein